MEADTMLVIRFFVMVGLILLAIALHVIPQIKAFKGRAFTGLTFATALVIDGLISPEVWLVSFSAFLGVKAYEKKSLPNGKNGVTQ